MPPFSPVDYGSLLSPLVAGNRCRALDAGQPDLKMRGDLEGATLPAAFAHTKVLDRKMAQCCLAGSWLMYDFLDESHAISQEVETPSGSFWHGVMHRREGDFSNAKYWFRRVGSHDVLGELGSRVTKLSRGDGDDALASRIAPGGEFDPYAFVDACQAALRGREGEAFCRRVQQAEWELLFDHCYRRAVIG